MTAGAPALRRASLPGSGPLCSPSGRVRARPPVPGDRYWRVSVYDTLGRRVAQTTAGRTRETAERRLRELDRRLAAHAPAGAAAVYGDELLDYFVAEDRPKNHGRPDRAPQWSVLYADQVRQLVDRYLRPVLGPLRLSAWAAEHAYAVLDRCPTNYMVGKLRRILSALLGVGVADGFLSPDQRDLHRVTVPLRPELRPRRDPPARQPDATVLVRPDEVPSTAQVGRLAAAGPPGLDPEAWAGTVNTLAYLGLRVGEWLGLSAPDVLGDQPPGLILVRQQLIEPRGGPKRLVPPKNGFARLVACCETTPLGFPLRDFLAERAAAAAREQRAGTNPAAALAVTPRGHWWTRSNFRQRCFNPGATAAGWERLSWRGPVRRRVAGRWVTVTADRQDWRHPPHALRHHYACTARDVWGWTGAELCLNGGWADEAFVLARYYGSTADSYHTALAKQAASPGAPRC